MALVGPYEPDSASVSEWDDTTIRTPTTTSDNFIAEFERDHDLRGWVPSQGSTVIIRSVSCGNAITLFNGHIVLAPLGSPGSNHWKCEETEGWLGFRNRASDRYLGRNWHGNMMCSTEAHKGWEFFTITPGPNGYIMQMPESWYLRAVVVTVEGGLRKLRRSGDKLADGIVWEFIKVA